MASLTGWRVSAVDDAGHLLPAFVRRYWPDAGVSANPWPPGLAMAHCAAVPDHVPPVEGCTCGLRATEDLAELLPAVTEKRFAGSSASILDETGVLARVELFGKLLPGVDIPADDPPTTWRGSQARVLDLHLAPALVDAQAALQARCGVPTATYAAQQWPASVAPLLAAVPARCLRRWGRGCHLRTAPADRSARPGRVLCLAVLDGARGRAGCGRRALVADRQRIRTAAAVKRDSAPAIPRDAGDDPDGYALAMNIARRHLTKGQIAMVAARAGYLSQIQAASEIKVSQSRIAYAKAARAAKTSPEQPAPIARVDDTLRSVDYRSVRSEPEW